jgi:HD-GYP domain-containing protein (c-di-GMP phosphodiesterase class II)
MEQLQGKYRKYKFLPGVISSLIGALTLSLFSILQKLILSEPSLIFQPRSYLVPVLYGGMTGLILGLWYCRLKQKESELLDAYNATLKGLAKAVEIRDKYTQDHTDRVVFLMEKLSRAMGVPEKDLVHMLRGALLHDIGKIGVPDAILSKPGVLTDEEREVMQQHPLQAKEMLAAIQFLRPATEIPCCHHECWDGSGYPNGFKGEEIPLSARIFAVIDVWDALTSDRPYRKAWATKDAIAYIEQNAGKLFDPQVVKVFLKNIHQLVEKMDQTGERLTTG